LLVWSINHVKYLVSMKDVFFLDFTTCNVNFG
jgi:hypothetical protein